MVSPTVSLAFLILCAFLDNTVEGGENRIIDGNYAKPNQFPYAVAIVEYSYCFCTGSIIKPSWVLTAAHCIYDKIEFPHRVVLQPNTIECNWLSTSNIYKADKLFVLPNFIAVKLEDGSAPVGPNDLGLIKIQGQFQETPILLGNVPPFSSVITLIGYGATYHGDRLNTLLKFAKMKLNSTDSFYEDQLTCTIIDGSACNGDSGGPAVSEDGHQFAVITAGTDNCSSIVSVTQIAIHKDWMEKTIAAHS